MGEISAKWSAAKKNLSDAQKAQLPKHDFGKKADEFEASVAKALKALSDAHLAVWAAYVDGCKPKSGSVFDLISELAELCVKDDAINHVIGGEIQPMSDLAKRKLNGVLKQYEENLKKSIDTLKQAIR